mmetsp:Transcript_10750/g.9465  ORF Transcript_10750/g.9465 Transcript_10750/m.9465 type:complete len:166 (-) Transcript_10750:2-499(-)
MNDQPKRPSELILIQNTENNFHLWNNSLKLKSLSPFYPKIYKMMTREICQINIFGFMLKKKQFQSLISHTKNLRILQLQECKIETLGEKFVDTYYKLKEIDLGNCGSLKLSDWVNNPEIFVSFLTAIKKCSLKDSLRIIRFNESDFRNQDIIDRCNDMGITLYNL